MESAVDVALRNVRRLSVICLSPIRGILHRFRDHYAIPRYDTPAEQALLRELYRKLAEFQDFFQPVMKLKGKVRKGGKLHRIYDEAKTPYQRLKESGVLHRKRQAELDARYEALNPAKLRREIDALRSRLLDLVESKDKESLPRVRRHGPGIERERARKRRLSEAAD